MGVNASSDDSALLQNSGTVGKYLDGDFNRFNQLFSMATENRSMFEFVRDELKVVSGLGRYQERAVSHTQLLHALIDLSFGEYILEFIPDTDLSEGERQLRDCLVEKIRSVTDVFVIDARQIEGDRASYDKETVLEWIVMAMKYGVRANTVIMFVPESMEFSIVNTMKRFGQNLNLTFGPSVRRLVLVKTKKPGKPSEIVLSDRDFVLTAADVTHERGSFHLLTDEGARRTNAIIKQTIKAAFPDSSPGATFRFMHVTRPHPQRVDDETWWKWTSDFVVEGSHGDLSTCDLFTGTTELDMAAHLDDEDTMLEVPPMFNFITGKKFVVRPPSPDEPDDEEFDDEEEEE